jgi:hypothetical protein
MRGKKRFLFAVSALLLALSACSTIETYQSGAGPGDLAVAGCHDLQMTSTVASASIPWLKMYFPNQEKRIAEEVEPLLSEVDLGISAYCEAASLVHDSQGLSDLLAKREEIASLIGRVQELIAAVKG